VKCDDGSQSVLSLFLPRQPLSKQIGDGDALAEALSEPVQQSRAVGPRPGTERLADGAQPFVPDRLRGWRGSLALGLCLRGSLRFRRATGRLRFTGSAD
jgi:hypothetical protein